MKRRRVDRHRRFVPSEQGRGVGNAGPHAIEQVVASGIISAIERMTECLFVCRTVALENQSAQAEQCCTVVPTMVQTPLESF